MLTQIPSPSIRTFFLAYYTQKHTTYAQIKVARLPKNTVWVFPEARIVFLWGRKETICTV